MIAAAAYQENISIPFNLQLIGAKAATTIIDGGYNGDVVASYSTAPAGLTNLAIRKGSGSHGGGVLNGGQMTITSCIISGNVAGAGGGIYNSGTLTITTSTITGNYAASTYSAAGGGIYNNGTLTINNRTLSKNAGIPNFVYGGAILNSGTLTINNSTSTGIAPPQSLAAAASTSKVGR